MTARARLALRRLRATPLASTLSVGTLVLGLGAVTTIVSLVWGILVQPLPYPEPGRLVTVANTAPGLGIDEFEQSPATYLLFRDHAGTLDETGLHAETDRTLSGAGAPVRLASADVSASLLRTLGVRPLAGRLLVDEDNRAGAEPVVLVSEELWRDRFGGDRTLLERTVSIDGVERRVVGIVPAAVDYPSADTDLWLPLELERSSLAVANFSFTLVARLAPGVGPEEAEQDLAAALARLPEEFPGPIDRAFLERSQMRPVVEPLRDSLVGDVAPSLWSILAAVVVLLLVATANVANLFLARAEGRRHEVAVRSALGAPRVSIVLDSVTETLLIAALGAVGALALAALATRVLSTTPIAELPRLAEVGLHPPVLAVLAGLVLGIGLALGLLPTRRSGADLPAALGDGGARGSAGRRRTGSRQLLVVFQVALALVLLVTSGLFVRSYRLLLDVEPGIRPEGALSLRIAPPAVRYPDRAATARLFERVLERARELPEVVAAGASSHPLFDRGGRTSFSIEGRPAPEGLSFVHAQRNVTPGWLAAVGVPLLEGRGIEPRDLEPGAAPVAVVNRSFARRHWGEESPLGRRIQTGDPDTDPWHEIVGVVADIPEDGLDRPAPETAWFPARGDGGHEYPLSTLVVRSATTAQSSSEGVRTAVAAVDPELAVFSMQPVASLLQAERSRPLFVMAMLLVAGGFTLVLGAAGLFGVLSYLVSLRTVELGIRQALGARRRDVERLVLGRALRLALTGAAIGALLALASGRLVASQLYGVSATDPLTFAAAILLVVGVALVAAWVPAARAGRVSPTRALRQG